MAPSNPTIALPKSAAPCRGGLVGGAISGAAAAGVALVPGVEELMRSEWVYNTRTVEPLATFAIAAGGGIISAAVSASLDTWPRRAGLLMAAIVLAVTQSLLLFHRLAIGWEAVSLAVAMITGALVAGLLTRSPSAAARWFEGRLNRSLVQRLSVAQNMGFLQPDEREAAVLTCSILNETHLRSQIPAREFLKIAESFRLTASRVLLDHGALLDETEAGTVRAFFGLPLPVVNHADSAARAALAVDDALRRLAVGQMKKDYAQAEFGAGISCGVLTAGLSGDAYAAAGDAVDQSRWLAALNADYHSAILTDGTTHRMSADTEDRPLEILNPPDGAALEVYQVLAMTGGLSREAMAQRDAFRDAIILLRAGHAADALLRFKEAGEGLTSPDGTLEHFVYIAQEQSARDSAGRKLPLPPASRPLRSTLKVRGL